MYISHQLTALPCLRDGIFKINILMNRLMEGCEIHFADTGITALSIGAICKCC